MVSGGSDFHQIPDAGLCLTRTRTRLRDSYDIARVIRERELIFDLSGTIIIPNLD